MQTYDAIVLGTGGVGSAALYHLAQRGLRVLGIDRFPAAHDRGSSHGDTRIIRQAYFEHPDYVPLLQKAYPLWAKLEEEIGQQLFFKVGLLQVGPPEGIVLSGVKASARQHALTIEELHPQEAEQRFPGFIVPENMAAVFEPQAGFLLVEQCVLAHLTLAAKQGAELRTGETALAIESQGNGVLLRTDREQYSAGRLILTAGPWLPELLGALKPLLQVRRKDVFWFGPAPTPFRMERGCPTYLYELPHGVFYGFPARDAQGMKVAEHSGGQFVADPLSCDRTFDAASLERVDSFRRQYLPQSAETPLFKSSVCLYTMTPDEHFIVDRHPEHSQVFFAGGLSGHGFKFAGVLGEALADLATLGQTSHPISFLRLERLEKFALGGSRGAEKTEQ